MERMPMRAPLARGVMLGLCLLSIVGCGGGGGGGNVRSDPPPAPSTPAPPTVPTDPDPPVTPIPPPETPPVTTPEPPVKPPEPVAPPADAHLSAIGADKIASRSATGLRLTLVDSGVDFSHPSLTTGIQTRTSATFLDDIPKDTSVSDANGHGTAVAQIMTGAPSGLFPGGVTRNVDLLSLRMLDDVPAADGGKLLTTQALDFLGTALSARGGVVTIATDAWHWQADVPVYDRFADMAVAKGLFVVEAGNSAQAQPSALARLPFDGGDARDLQSSWLVVAALDSSQPTRLAGYSNACGVAKESCLVAPGDVVVNGIGDTPTDTTYRTMHGTEYAAAQIGAAAAIVSRTIKYLSPDLLRQTLLGSASDLGAPGVDEVFGHGLLNLEVALRGPSRFDWGDVYVAVGLDPQTWSNNISGSGGLTLTTPWPQLGQYGILHLTGDNTYTGKTVVKDWGWLVVTGDLASPVEIGDYGFVDAGNGTWSGDVDIGMFGSMTIYDDEPGAVTTFLGNLTNSGSLWVDGRSTAIVKGDYTQIGTGTRLFVDVGAPVLQVGGVATLDGKLLIDGLVTGYVANSRTEILKAEGGVVGVFSSYSAASYLTLVATLHYDANTVWLDVERADMADVAGGLGLVGQALGSAQRLERTFDAIDAGHIVEGTASSFTEGAAAIQRVTSAADYERSLSSLSGELHDMDSAFAMMAIDGNRNAVESRLDTLGAGIASGAWSQSLDGMRQWSAFDVDTSGWMIGFDQRGINGVTVGASLSETSGSAWHAQRYDRERNRQVDGQLYASWDLGEGRYVLGSVGFGHMQRWLQREVWLGDEPYRVSSDYAHRYGTLSLQAGRRIAFGGSSAITPYVGMQTLQLVRDGFSEEGASGFGLTSSNASMSAAQALAGVRWNRGWLGNATRWSLSGRVEWQRLLSQSGETIQARFTGMDAWAPIVADGLGRDVGVVGLGLEAGVGRRSTLRLDLDSRHGDGEQWTGAMATWSTAF